MKPLILSDLLWGKKAKFLYLFGVSAMLLFAFLGAREIWTQEHRWADIVSGMFFRHDFLHPYLGEEQYYDKPLLSYWLVALSAKLLGELTTVALRFPSALAGLLAIYSIYSLGSSIKNKSLGLLSGWLLLTTFYFLFWARTSSADMLNLAGSLFAVAWYYKKRLSADFFDYFVFFSILAVTSLCKGLGGATIPLIAVLTDIVLQRSWKQHLKWPLFLALIPALILYFLPFLASSYLGDAYRDNGLYLVYRENILRYFHPFDHKGPFYTYFIYLPVYLFPWVVFFFPALFSIKSRFKTMSNESKWLSFTLLLLFLFFTLSGSRRNYYILPVVPFAILFIADWILSSHLSTKWISGLIVTLCTAFLLLFSFIQPFYYSHTSVAKFATILKKEAIKIKPWEDWQIVMLDGEDKLKFYLRLPPTTKNYGVKNLRELETKATLAQAWPILKEKNPKVIFLSRQLYKTFLIEKLPEYRIVEFKSNLFSLNENNEPIAFIPANKLDK